MAFVRSIGKFGLTALIVNSVIGSAIFGVPAEMIRLVGRASPLAMIVGAVEIAVIMLCFAEVASQFSEPGGAYLYARTALGRFAGLQTGWFMWACFLVAASANANLFVTYMSGLVPWAGTVLGRAIVITVVVVIPTAANYVGVRSGSWLSIGFCIAKLIPLAAIVVLGLVRFGQNATMLPMREVTGPGISNWLAAMLVDGFSYAGFEFALTPGGEVVNPRRTVPIALAAGFGIVVATYTLIQFVTVSTLGSTPSTRPLADVATALIGRGGGYFVSVGAMISAYGFLSATILAGPRLTYSLAEKGDFPAFFAALHPQHKTPHVSLVIFSILLVVLSITGSFRWALAVGSAALLVYYAFVCLSLIRLRKLRASSGIRVPGGSVLAWIGIAMVVALLSTLKTQEAVSLVVTALIATANWWWVNRKQKSGAEASASAAD